MDLEFNITVHILCFLVKHDSQQFSSQTLAKLTCLNPAQLRRMITILNQYQFIETSRGKNGGYSADHSAASIKLSVLYRIFVLKEDNQQRTFTGHGQSDCEVSRSIVETISHYNQKEHRVTLNFYNTFTTNDVINDAFQEDTTYDTL